MAGAYLQPLANPGLGALVPVAARARPEIAWSLTLDGRGLTDPVRWLLASPAGQWLAGGGAHCWLIDPNTPAELAFDAVKDNSFPVFLPGGQHAYLTWKGFLARPTPPAPPDLEHISYLPHMDALTTVNAFVPVGDELIMLIQNYGSRTEPQAREALAFRKPFDQSLVTIRWEVSLDLEAARSPALSDGTLAVHLPQEIRLIDVHGEQVATITERLRPDRLSANERVWGFRRAEETLELVAFDREGQPSLSTALTVEDPSQPPVLFADGRVGVVTPGQVSCYAADGSPIWEHALPAGPPGATATGDGHLLVSAGVTLACIDPEGRQVWELAAPAPITSNPTVGSDGRVGFAAGSQVFGLAST